MASRDTLQIAGHEVLFVELSSRNQRESLLAFQPSYCIATSLLKLLESIARLAYAIGGLKSAVFGYRFGGCPGGHDNSGPDPRYLSGPVNVDSVVSYAGPCFYLGQW